MAKLIIAIIGVVGCCTLIAASALILMVPRNKDVAHTTNLHYDQLVTTIHASLVHWDLDEIVAESDAVIIGTVSQDFGSNPVPFHLGKEDDIVYVLKDYAVTVEEYLHPAGGATGTISLTTMGGDTMYKGKQVAYRPPDDPALNKGEKILVFLRHIPEEAYDGFGHPLPEGFTNKDHYGVLVSQDYGKFVVADDGTATDPRSNKRLNVQDVRDAIAEAHSAD